VVGIKPSVSTVLGHAHVRGMQPSVSTVLGHAQVRFKKYVLIFQVLKIVFTNLYTGGNYPNNS
jgi:hypothetical protein